VIIVGAQRSGTTLVRLLLDAHPSIAIGPETAFLQHVAQGVASFTGEGRRRQDGYLVDPDRVEAELVAAWTRVLDAHARAAGASRWGEKSPVHRYHGQAVKRLLPGSQLVAVVRHPAAVAASRGRWGYEQRETVRDWASTVRHHLDDAERFGPARFRLVRFEDLLREPRPTMERLLAFLHEPWDERVLDHASQVPEGVVTDGGTVASAPLDPSRATAWTSEVDHEDLAVLHEEAAEELALVGYSADPTTPVLALPDSPFTDTAPGPDAVGVLRRVVRQHGVQGTVRRAGQQLRALGARGVLDHWRRL